MSQNTRRNLKQKAFERDGWQDVDGHWYVMCAFGCGDILVHATATLDRYPIMGQHGGTYTLENIRLACKPCNSANENRHDLAARQSAKKKARAERKKARRAVIEPLTEEDQRRRRIHAATQESDRLWNTEKASFRSPQYSREIKRKLKENYPSCEGRDRNGIIRMDF